MNFIECKHCRGLYNIEKIEDGYCDWCRTKLEVPNKFDHWDFALVWATSDCSSHDGTIFPAIKPINYDELLPLEFMHPFQKSNKIKKIKE